MRPLSPKHVSSMFAHWTAIRLVGLMLILLGILKQKLEASSQVDSVKDKP